MSRIETRVIDSDAVALDATQLHLATKVHLVALSELLSNHIKPQLTAMEAKGIPSNDPYVTSIAMAAMTAKRLGDILHDYERAAYAAMEAVTGGGDDLNEVLRKAGVTPRPN